MWTGVLKVSPLFSICYAFHMTAEQLISLNLKTYLSMREIHGKDDPEVVQLYGKLKNMIIVEVYFMGFLRNLIDDDEMSGFILFINDDIDGIIERFRKTKGHFMRYLKDSLENRALAYLKLKLKRASINRSISEFYCPDIMAVAEASPEDAYICKENAREARWQKSLMFSVLRDMCMRVRSRRIKLFTFFCTIMPFLSRDVIDGFCESINCDREQTLIIANQLCRIQERENQNRYSKYYLSRMVDFHWSKILEYEGHAQIALNPEFYKKKADLNRKKLRESLKGFFNAKMHTPYSSVARILNMEPQTVSAYVMYAKKILEKVISDQSLYNMTPKSRIKQPGLSRFEPFTEFGIGTRKRC